MDQGSAERKRYGHTMSLWDGKLVMVGGSKMYNRDMKRRECLNDIQIYDPPTNIWKEIMPNGAYLEPRRYHATCIVGHHMVVNGGLNDKDAYLNSTLAINLTGLMDKDNDEEKVYRWVQLKTENTRTGNVAHHACQLVVAPERYKYIKLVSLTSMPDLRYGKAKVPYEGIYYFGGRDELGPNNDLYIIRIGRKPIEWIKPGILGPTPPARYGHSMSYIPEKGILVIFGGRNDDFFESDNTSCLDDIWILVLERMQWCEWSKNEGIGSVPASRYSHCSAVIGGSIIIFGGIGDANYCDTRIFAIDMNIAGMHGARFDKSPILSPGEPASSPKGALGEIKGILMKKATQEVRTTLAPGAAAMLGMNKFNYNI